MSILENILLYTSLGSVGSLIGGMLLLSREKLALRISHLFASFAAGVMLAAAFFDLLPEALELSEDKGVDVFLWVLIGFLMFFVMERFIHWFHHHEEYHEENEKKSIIPLIVIGDTMHNFLDGVVIAATFMVSPPIGIVTTLAVFAHELPQEIGDFGVMLHRGVSKGKIILINIFSALAAFIGAFGTYILGNVVEPYIPLLLSITAGFFIYIAASDLIPEIHHEKRKGFAFYETLLLIVGIFVIYLAVHFLHEG